jgi:hypothetical protein
MPVLFESARVRAETGDESSAVALFEEALDLLRQLENLGYAVFQSHTVAWLARLFDRTPDVEAIFSRSPTGSRWLTVAEAVLTGELRRVADILADIDAPAWEAFYRLHAGTERDVHAAMNFYRGVRATRYVREGEAMLAASA